MTRLVHLTDLHFGLHRAELVGPLREAIRANTPDLVVVSGDLTQRALQGQFAEAMAFLRGLDLPLLVIPGNHDVPLYNPFARLFTPFGPYRAGVARDMTPVAQIGRLRLFGTNTADPLQWRGGKTRGAEIDGICRALLDGPVGVTNILVAHHPFEEPPGFARGETRGARAALEKLAEAGLHVLLTGHLHHWVIGLGVTDDSPRAVFQMQTGTALCARAQERDHGVAVMAFDADGLSVTPWIVNEAILRFEPSADTAFAYRDGGWWRAQ